MRHAALGGMDGGAAEGLVVHVLAGDALHDRRTGQVHVGSVLHHQGEVREGGGIHRTAGARAEDTADLRHHARSEDVPFKDLSETGQGVDAFLDARAAGIVQADDRGAGADRQVHHLANLFGHRLGQGSAGDGEILRKDIHYTAVDGAAAGHHAVAVEVLLVHAEVRAAVLHEHIVLLEAALEAAFVEKERNPLAGGQLALGMLGLDAFLPAAETGVRAPLNQLLDVLSLNAHSRLSLIRANIIKNFIIIGVSGQKNIPSATHFEEGMHILISDGFYSSSAGFIVV